MEDPEIAVIGAGLIGRGWAVVFARAGRRVRLWDPAPGACEEAVAEIGRQAAPLFELGLSCAPEALLSRIEIAPSLAAALDGVDYVQENGPERLEAKRALFADLDAAAPAGAALASSSSGIPSSAFSEALPGRARCLVAHPVNPPHLVPVVEISPSPWTDPEIAARATAIMAAVGQSPVLVKREIDGFILNRLQGALLNEALRLVEGGYVDPEDLDKTVRDGLGLRWAFMGPFETIDLNAPGGVRDYAGRYGPLFGSMAEAQSAPPNWGDPVIGAVETARRERLGAAALADRQAWRDSRLAALAAFKKTQPE